MWPSQFRWCESFCVDKCRQAWQSNLELRKEADLNHFELWWNAEWSFNQKDQFRVLFTTRGAVKNHPGQRDQIGRNFAIWANFFCLGRNFFQKFIYYWAIFWAKFYLLWASFFPSLFTIGWIFFRYLGEFFFKPSGHTDPGGWSMMFWARIKPHNKE